MIFILLNNISPVATDLPLDPNETYTVNRTVTLPSGAVGSGYLLFKTDAYNYQTESNENDNVYTQAIDIGCTQFNYY
jgi:subtilase family serine protease